MRRPIASFVTILCLGGAAVAGAHNVGAAPNLCTFDIVDVAASIGAGAVGPPQDGEVYRLIYDIDESTVQFQATIPLSRTLTVGQVQGTIALEPFFQARVDAAGDLRASDVALTITADGQTVTSPVALTTALTSAEGVVIGGKPIGSDGTVALAAVIPSSALPTALAGGPLTLRMQCPLLPAAPDVDQFTRVATLSGVRGSVSGESLTLRGKLRAGSRDPIAPSGALIVLIETSAGPLAELVLPDGFRSDGPRAFVAASADGSTSVRLKTVKRKPKPTYRVDVVSSGVVVPVGVSSLDVTISLVAGDIAARQSGSLRVRAGRR